MFNPRGLALPIASMLFSAASPLAAQSLNVTLESNLDAYGQYSDIWGYRSGNGKELAIIGTLNGTSFINATNPQSLNEVAFISGPTSQWRDIKTFGAYAYIVNETGGGLQIVDLSNPLSPSLIRSDTTYFQTAHNLYIDEPDSMLYACATDGTGMMMFSLADPESVSLVLDFTDFYVHDVHVQNGVAYTAAVHLGAMGIIDVSNLPSYTVIDTVTTVDAFCHNTWATPDDLHCLTTDEVLGGHVQIFDVSNPANAQAVSEWSHPTDPSSIVHNATVLGDLAFISWYKTGLQVLDIANPVFPQRVGFYDTFPDSGYGFDGAWGVYPFQPSGNIYISDISTGLYVLSFDPDYGDVVGTVTDDADQEPLGGVRVAVLSEENEVLTTSTGEYRLSLVPGNYDVVFELFGYIPDTSNVQVARGGTSTLDVSLIPIPLGDLRGFVGGYGSYTPIEGADVVLDGTPFTTTTDASGRFEILGIPVGSYACLITVLGYSPFEEVASIVVGENELNATVFPAVFIDDLETSVGWTIGIPSDNASRGLWELADPEGTGGGTLQPEDDHTENPGILAFVTDGSAGPSDGSGDVDGGITSILSPVLDLSGLSDVVLTYHRWYVNDGAANPGEDVFEVHVSNNGGGTWATLEITSESNHYWQRVDHSLDGVLAITDQMQFRFRASDFGGGSLVEALVDDIQVSGVGTSVSVPLEPGRVLTNRLEAASPNPFQAATRIAFQLETAAEVTLEVFDIRGRRVKVLVDEYVEAGTREMAWDGRDERGRRLPGGVYFLRWVTPELTRKQKLIISGR